MNRRPEGRPITWQPIAAPGANKFQKRVLVNSEKLQWCKVASIQPPHNDSGHGEYGRVSDCVRNDVVTIVKVSQTWRAHTNNAGYEVAAAQLARLATMSQGMETIT
ncbi:hypothetical protein Tco_0217986 [Tanacetum coccineum]